jgi:hypothetical protein
MGCLNVKCSVPSTEVPAHMGSPNTVPQPSCPATHQDSEGNCCGQTLTNLLRDQVRHSICRNASAVSSVKSLSKHSPFVCRRLSILHA